MSPEHLLMLLYLRKAFAPAETNAQALAALRADFRNAHKIVARFNAATSGKTPEQVAGLEAAADAFAALLS